MSILSLRSPALLLRDARIGAPLLAACAAGAVSAALLLAVRSLGVAPRRLLQDPAGQYDFPPFVGLISHGGVALLVATAAILAFAAAVGRRDAGLLAGAAALSGMLAADDLLLLHERVVPAVLGLGETWLYGLYGVLLALILARLPRRRGSLGILVPLSLMAVSVGTDQMELPMNTRVLVEDLAKVAGFAAWLAFWAGFAAARLREGLTTAPELAGPARATHHGAWPTR